MDTGSQDDNAEQPTPPSASWKAVSLDGGAGAGAVESAGLDNEDEVDSGIALVETSLQPMKAGLPVTTSTQDSGQALQELSGLSLSTPMHEASFTTANGEAVENEAGPSVSPQRDNRAAPNVLLEKEEVTTPGVLSGDNDVALPSVSPKTEDVAVPSSSPQEEDVPIIPACRASVTSVTTQDSVQGLRELLFTFLRKPGSTSVSSEAEDLFFTRSDQIPVSAAANDEVVDNEADSDVTPQRDSAAAPSVSLEKEDVAIPGSSLDEKNVANTEDVAIPSSSLEKDDVPIIPICRASVTSVTTQDSVQGLRENLSTFLRKPGSTSVCSEVEDLFFTRSKQVPVSTAANDEGVQKEAGPRVLPCEEDLPAPGVFPYTKDVAVPRASPEKEDVAGPTASPEREDVAIPRTSPEKEDVAIPGASRTGRLDASRSFISAGRRVKHVVKVLRKVPAARHELKTARKNHRAGAMATATTTRDEQVSKRADAAASKAEFDLTPDTSSVLSLSETTADSDLEGSDRRYGSDVSVDTSDTGASDLRVSDGGPKDRFATAEDGPVELPGALDAPTEPSVDSESAVFILRSGIYPFGFFSAVAVVDEDLEGAAGRCVSLGEEGAPRGSFFSEEESEEEEESLWPQRRRQRFVRVSQKLIAGINFMSACKKYVVFGKTAKTQHPDLTAQLSPSDSEKGLDRSTDKRAPLLHVLGTQSGSESSTVVSLSPEDRSIHGNVTILGSVMVFEDPSSDDDGQIAGVGRQEAEASGAKVVQPDLSTTVSTIPSSPSPSRDVAHASQMSPRVERSILRAVQQIREAKQHLKMLGKRLVLWKRHRETRSWQRRWERLRAIRYERTPGTGLMPFRCVVPEFQSGSSGLVSPRMEDTRSISDDPRLLSKVEQTEYSESQTFSINSLFTSENSTSQTTGTASLGFRGIVHQQSSENDDALLSSSGSPLWTDFEEETLLRQRQNALMEHPFFLLDVRLQEGKDLVVRDSCEQRKNSPEEESRTSDPYVKFKIGGKQVYRSRTIFKNLNPKWEENFTIPIEDVNKPIHIKVFDYDRGLHDDPMGTTEIDLSQLELGKTTELKLLLSDRGKPDYMGYLLLTCTLHPKTQEDKDQYLRRSVRPTEATSKKMKMQSWSGVLTIVLVEGCDLVPMDDNGLSDPYVKFRLGNEKYRSKHQKKTLSPRWLEQFDLRLYNDQSSQLEISVFDYDVTGKDDFMGRATIDVSSLEPELTHHLDVELEDGAGLLKLLLTISGTCTTDAQSDLCNYTPDSRQQDELRRKYSLLKLSSLSDVGHLQVKVFKANGLKSADLGGQSDPFCVLELVNARLQTHTEYKTLNPEWNKVFIFKVRDIHSVLEVTVFDEDRDKKVEFLGKVAIPLLRIRSGERRWYALKDKKLMHRTKGAILLEMDLVFNHVKAAVRTINPAEEKFMQIEPKFKIHLMKRNIDRVSQLISTFVEGGKFLQSCFSWESTPRSATAFIVFLVMVWNFELYMLPITLLLIFLKNLIIAQIVGAFKREPVEDDYFDEEEEDEDEEKEKFMAIFSVLKVEEKKSFKEKLQSIQDVCLQVQQGMDMVASLGERIKNTFNWSVPWLSTLAVIALSAGVIVLYFIPLRLLILAWGINKFTKKLRKPNAISNNELLDFLSRVPSDSELAQYRELRPELSPGPGKKKRS